VSRSGLSTEAFIARLADDLEPVRAVPSLYRQILAVTAIWAGSAAVVASWLGLHPLTVLERGGISTSLVGVLALVGFGGVTLGLACRIPGRERVALAAASGVVLGVVVASVVGLVLPGSLADAGPVAEGMACAERSLLLAIPSGLAAIFLALRGAPWRPRAAGLGLTIGATSLGALLVHLSCPSQSPWHWWLAHALVPLAVGPLIGFLVASVLRHLGLRSRLRASRALEA
jgi:hypothetical protein